MVSESTGPQAGPAVDIASCVIRVSNLDQSLKFYCDVFSCRVLIHEPDMALLLTPTGFQLYLRGDNRVRRRAAAAIGVQYLMWATDSQADLDRIMQRLRAYDVAAFSYAEGGVTFVEGCDPDGGRVIVAYPSPRQLPREVIANRLHG